MSSITIRATFALAMPMNESAPVWSVITPTLMGSMIPPIESAPPIHADGEARVSALAVPGVVLA